MGKGIRSTICACAAALLAVGALIGQGGDVSATPAAQAVHSSYAASIPTHPSLKNKPSGPQLKAVARAPLPRDPASLKAAKANADRAASAPAPLTGARAGTATATLPRAASFNGLGTNGLSDPAVSPSDSTGDVSPTNVLEVVNSQIGLYDRSLNLIQSTTLAAFGGVAPVGLGDCILDPQIAWDQQAGRWEYSMLDLTASSSCASPTSAYLDYGWSMTSDPLGGWCGYGLQTGTTLADYEKLGHNDMFITIGANEFANFGNSNQFLGAFIFAIVKPANGSTACPQPSPTIFQFFNLTNADGTAVVTPVPADTTDSSGLEYIVSAEDPGNGTASNLTVWHLVGGAASATLYRDAPITVPGYSVPPPVPQPSTGTRSCSTAGNCLDSLDSRITQAVAHFDPSAHAETIWTQHAVADAAVGTLSIERWYELTPGQTVPRQTGTVSDPLLHIFNGAISPTTAGNEAVIFYNTANGSTTGFPDYRAQRRTSTTPLGTTTAEVVIAASTASDADFSCGMNMTPTPTGDPCRWGDYAAARPDPINANTVWGVGMLVNGFGGGVSQSGWTTEIARMTPGCSSATLTGPAQAVPGDLVLYTATSTDCSNPLYQFWLRNTDGSWTLKQTGPSNTWTWDSSGYPTASGGQVYVVVVWATQAGDTQTVWDAYAQTSTTLGQAPPCGQAGINGAPASPTSVGGSIAFSATVGASTCRSPMFQYWLLPPGGAWTVIRPFSSDPNWTWKTALLVPGQYSVAVWANQRGDSTATFESVAVVNVTLTGCSSLTASPAPGSPQVAGAAILITASASGCGTPLYQFWILTPGSSVWQDVLPYSPANTYNWLTASSPVGMYRWVVWAKQTGSGGSAGNSLGRWDAVASFTFTLSTGACTGAGASALPASPQVATTKVTITGTATGCAHASPIYQFWMLAPGGSWQDVQQYSTTATYPWDTTGSAPGTYSFNVWVRDASSAGTSSNSLGSWDAYAAFTFQVTTNPCSSVTASPVANGKVITITAQASTCTQALYEFWRLDPGSGTYVKVQAYSTIATLTWDTTSAAKGTYHFIVFARDKTSPGTSSNSVASWDAYTSLTWTVT